MQISHSAWVLLELPELLRLFNSYLQSRTLQEYKEEDQNLKLVIRLGGGEVIFEFIMNAHVRHSAREILEIHVH